MNCKPGDLAVIRVVAGHVPRAPELIGRLVQVVRAAHDGEWLQSVDGNPMKVTLDGHGVAWIIEAATPMPWHSLNGNRIGMFMQRAMADMFLRPLRDNDGEDETLQWAGKPQEVTA